MSGTDLLINRLCLISKDIDCSSLVEEKDGLLSRISGTVGVCLGLNEKHVSISTVEIQIREISILV